MHGSSLRRLLFCYREAGLASAGGASNCAVVVPRRYVSILSVCAHSFVFEQTEGAAECLYFSVPLYS